MPGALPPLPISGDTAFSSLHITALVDADRLCRSGPWVITSPGGLRSLWLLFRNIQRCKQLGETKVTRG